jgi:hypothetical protein
MSTESLAEVVRSLRPQEQDAVLQFIDYLKQRDASVHSDRPTSGIAAAPRSVTRYPALVTSIRLGRP